jgi:hypothetical protein
VNISGVECLRRELKTALGILERRKSWDPFSTTSALFAHARQLMGALRATTAGAAEGGECEALEERLRNAHTKIR